MKRRSVAAVQSQGEPKVFVTKQKSRRHHANQGYLLSIQRECAVDDGWICVEIFLPEAIAHHRNWGSTAPRVVGDDASTEQRLHAQKLEGIGANFASLKLFGALLVRVEDVGAPIGDDVFKDVVLLFEVEVLRNREIAASFLVGARVVMNKKSR